MVNNGFFEDQWPKLGHGHALIQNVPVGRILTSQVSNLALIQF